MRYSLALRTSLVLILTKERVRRDLGGGSSKGEREREREWVKNTERECIISRCVKREREKKKTERGRGKYIKRVKVFFFLVFGMILNYFLSFSLRFSNYENIYLRLVIKNMKTSYLPSFFSLCIHTFTC